MTAARAATLSMDAQRVLDGTAALRWELGSTVDNVAVASSTPQCEPALGGDGRRARLIEVKVLPRVRVTLQSEPHTRQADADMLVMGAVGRSRVSEFVVGGATWTVLGAADLPVLLSR